MQIFEVSWLMLLQSADNCNSFISETRCFFTNCPCTREKEAHTGSGREIFISSKVSNVKTKKRGCSGLKTEFMVLETFLSFKVEFNNGHAILYAGECN